MFTKEELLEAQSMTNTDNKTVYQKFNTAVRHGNIDDVKLAHKGLEADGVDLAKSNVFAGAALRDAIHAGNTECVKFLLDNGAKVEFQKHLVRDKFLPDAISTFMDIDQEKACELAKILINAGVDINDKNYQGYTPLMLSAMTGLTSLVDVLLEAGADLDILSNREEVKAEDLAIDKGHSPIAEAIRQTRNQREEKVEWQKNDELATKRAKRIQARSSFRSHIRRMAV